VIRVFSDLFGYSVADFLGAGVNNLDNLLLSIADIHLSVHLFAHAIIISVDGEDLLALAVEDIYNISAVEGDTSHEGAVLHEVHRGREGAALGVGLHADGKIEAIAAVSDLVEVSEAEVDNLDITSVGSGCNVGDGISGGAGYSARVADGSGSRVSLRGFGLDGKAETFFSLSLKDVIVVKVSDESDTSGVFELNFSCGSAASVITVLGNGEVVVEGRAELVEGVGLVVLGEIDNLQVARGVPLVVVRASVVLVSIVGSVVSPDVGGVVASNVGVRESVSESVSLVVLHFEF